MRIIEPYAEILLAPNGETVLKHLELCGRVSYKSEDKITENSAAEFLSKRIAQGHESVLEHIAVTVKFVVDRGVSHELVRHRLASYTQESTRYCNYARGDFHGDITFIKPLFFKDDPKAFAAWYTAMQQAEEAYFDLLDKDRTPQEARSVLPNSVKTEVVMTADLREWRHFFRLRCAPAAHPQMRQVTIPLLHDFQKRIPVLFDDISF